MATAIMKCRVCGKEYEGCRTLKRVAGVFRWQEVACSPECGSIYLAKIEASRGITPKEDKAVNNAEIVEESAGSVVELFDDDDDDELYELDDYFDCDAEETAIEE